MYYLEVQTDYLHFDTQSLTLQFSQCILFFPPIEKLDFKNHVKNKLKKVVKNVIKNDVKNYVKSDVKKNIKNVLMNWDSF